MSAIAGIYFPDGRPVDRADVARMLARLAHRGPDDTGMWCCGAVGLGHNMLRTTPESMRETLPRQKGANGLTITADARIDNRRELIAELGLGDRPPGDITDSDLILLAYEEWGEACPQRLLGDFAFAIWDERRQILFCARDHFGVKPLYYHHSDRIFAFASEIKGLLCLADVPRRLNEVRVADYLVPMLEDKEITFYRGVLRLPPAHSMRISRDGARLTPYWAPDPSREIRYASDAQYAEAFREIFTEAVRCRLRSAFPVGSLLSGGLDSSSVVCTARELLSENGHGPLHTFSAVFDDAPECDESPYFNAVIAQGGVEAHYVPRHRIDPRADVPWLLRHEDEPLLAPYTFLYVALYRAAQEHRIRVVLDGIDGDTTVSHGVGYLTELACARRWITLTREIVALARRLNRPRWRIFRERALLPFVPDSVLHLTRTLRGRDGPPWGRNTIISPSFARRIGLTERFAALRKPRLTRARTSKEDHLRGLTWGVHPFLLEVIDRAAAAFSVDCRHVGFDVRLAEFCLGLPGEQKLCQGWTRMVMRRAMASVLPERVRSRGGKNDVSPALSRSLVDFDGRPAEDMIRADAEIVGEYVDVNALRRAYERYRSKGAHYEAVKVWWAASLAAWLREAELRP